MILASDFALAVYDNVSGKWLVVSVFNRFLLL